MKVLLLAVVLAIASASILTEREYAVLFAKWMKDNNKVYTSPDELAYRYKIFKENMDKIITHNAQNTGSTMVMNRFGDMTNEEFKTAVLCLNTRSRIYNSTAVADPANDIDWTTRGAVTGVKDQANCGSCWAFSTTGTLEGYLATTGKGLTSLSESELVDCDTNDSGCSGGLMENALRWIQSNGGLCAESAYPYRAAKSSCNKGSCSSVSGTRPNSIQMCNGESGIASCLNTRPVAIGLDASNFQFYGGGTFSNCACGQMNHGVLAVGIVNGNWKIKNSWGASWGSSGYIYIPYGKGCACLGQYGVIPN
jgi:cathepsin L